LRGGAPSRVVLGVKLHQTCLRNYQLGYTAAALIHLAQGVHVPQLLTTHSLCIDRIQWVPRQGCTVDTAGTVKEWRASNVRSEGKGRVEGCWEVFTSQQLGDDMPLVGPSHCHNLGQSC
jgi:hypothetical protein